MRLWSLHPKYLDTKGLVALWRESLLAKHVLEGKTKGYRHHPQLNRFKKSASPVQAINYYLSFVYEEASMRGFNFEKGKIDWEFVALKIPVTSGQLAYEVAHLLKKLEVRDSVKYQDIIQLTHFEQHPIFELITGDTEDWEVRPLS